MTDGARKHYVSGGALALLGTCAVVLILQQAENESGGTDARPGRLWSRLSSFTVAGDATEPIVPGSSAAIDLEFDNPHRLPVRVSEVQVKVRDVRAPHADPTHPCDVNDYTVHQIPADTEITIPARGTHTLSGLGLPQQAWPRIGLADDAVNQDGCKGASLVLAYTASGSVRR